MRKLDTSELGPVKLDTAPRVLKLGTLGGRIEGGRVTFLDPADFDVVLWRGVRFVKEQP